MGVPGRIVKQNVQNVDGASVDNYKNDLDQIHFPDPIIDEIACLRKQNNELKSQIEDIYKMIKEGKK